MSLKQRAVTALVLAPFAVAAILLLPTVWFAGILALIWAAGAIEWARLIGYPSIAARTIGVVVLPTVCVALWFTPKSLDATLALGIAWWVLVPIWLKSYGFAQADTPKNRAIKTLAGVLVLVPAWAAAMIIHGAGDRGPQWAMYVVLLIWAADVGAYAAGRTWGKRKLAPRISPGKTIEGVAGALVASVAFAALGAWWFDVHGTKLALFLVLSVVTVAFSIVGDLFESLIKRHAGQKDSGTIFPGHGGVLDRLDSLFAALPIFAAGRLALLGF